MTPEYEITTLSLIVKPVGEPIFDERTTIIQLEDEADGAFLILRQINDASQPGEVRFDTKEWPKISEAIEMMITVCNNENKDK
jgi:hypothetical protein